MAARFEALGLKPGAGRGWFQPVTLRASKREADAAFASLSRDGKEGDPLVHGKDYLIGRSLASSTFDISAPTVFVGYGVSEPGIGYDDYAGMDVAGKIVIAFGDAPKSFDSEQYAYFRTGDYKLKTAAKKGAIGFVTIPSKAQLQRFPWDRQVLFSDRERITWVHPDGVGDVAAREIRGSASMSPAGAAKLFDGEKTSFADLQAAVEAKAPLTSFALNKSLTLRGASTFTEKPSANVVGVISGADPDLRDEVVVLSAHLDHVGVFEPRGGGEDKIHNGALDNAMGVATMLDVARTFANGEPPARTLVFLAVTAEEKGLIGADYFAHYPTIGDREIVANVNLDMPLALYPFSDVIAFGAER
ncbi:MAG: M28 family metallopeptidase, partial [Planctomycetota bacterium]